MLLLDARLLARFGFWSLDHGTHLWAACLVFRLTLLWDARRGYYSHAGGKNQRPSGSAVVEFVYAEAAAAAIEALENTELDGRDLRVRQYFSS